MFINFWYAIEESYQITNEPVKLTFLGQDFVLFEILKA